MTGQIAGYGQLAEDLIVTLDKALQQLAQTVAHGRRQGVAIVALRTIRIDLVAQLELQLCRLQLDVAGA